MAKATKAQRQARIEESEKQLDEEFLASWPAQLMSLLERASGCGFHIDVDNGAFVVSFVDKWNDTVSISLENLYATRQNTEDQADRLNWALKDFEEARREAECKASLIASAKRKLNQEELEALGIK